MSANNNFKLHTENVPGNMHQAATTINSWGWAEYVITMEVTGNYTVVVFKMPTDMVHRIRKGTRAYVSAYNRDDYKDR